MGGFLYEKSPEGVRASALFFLVIETGFFLAFEQVIPEKESFATGFFDWHKLAANNKLMQVLATAVENFSGFSRPDNIVNNPFG
jgi:hypothetical protein